MAAKKAPKKSTARKAPAKRTARAKPVGQVENPFEKNTPRFKVAALMLRKGLHSWDELKEAAGGTLSTRTFGAVLVALEDKGARFAKSRHEEWGVCYELDPSAGLIGNHNGADVTGEYDRDYSKTAKKAPAKKAPAKKAAAKKAPAKTAKRPAGRARRKR